MRGRQWRCERKERLNLREVSRDDSTVVTRLYEGPGRVLQSIYPFTVTAAGTVSKYELIVDGRFDRNGRLKSRSLCFRDLASAAIADPPQTPLATESLEYSPGSGMLRSRVTPVLRDFSFMRWDETAFQYDGAGRVRVLTQHSDGTIRSTSVIDDALGIVYNDSGSDTIQSVATWDDANRTEQVEQTTTLRGQAPKREITKIEYSTNRVVFKFPSAVSDSTFDAQGRMTQQATTGMGFRRFTYDAANRLTEQRKKPCHP